MNNLAKTIIAAVGSVGHAAVDALSTPPIATSAGTGRKRKVKAPCSPCAAKAQLRAAKEAVRRGTL